MVLLLKNAIFKTPCKSNVFQSGKNIEINIIGHTIIGYISVLKENNSATSKMRRVNLNSKCIGDAIKKCQRYLSGK